MSLEELGIRAGERVRWRPRDGARWVEGTVTARERDGSIGVRDPQGRSRALPLERLEVRSTGPRGAAGWEPAVDRASRTEQLGLFP
jgi:hypothetical protein